MQSSRPAKSRLGDAFAGFWEGIREVPAVPAAAVAAVLVVAVGIGIFAYSGLGRGGGGAATSSALSEGASRNYATGTFGRLPTPVFNGGAKSAPTSQGLADTASPEYLGPVQLTWTGKLDLTITTAPVFRYHEPSTNTADQFATALGAVLRERPAGFLGSYSASTYTLKVRGTVQSPQSSPAFFIFSSLSMPPIDAAGAGPSDLADIFLAQHSLSPQWSYAVAVDGSGDPVKVVYQRQFDAPGYGPAFLIDGSARRTGIEVDLSNNRPVLVSGLLPVSLDVASYKVVSAADAISYRHMPELGGLRKPRPDSINLGWRNISFRGYADYMQTDQFWEGIGRLLELDSPVIMCAEAVPWRCHRSLIADALTLRGIEVRHITGISEPSAHAMTPFGRAH